MIRALALVVILLLPGFAAELQASEVTAAERNQLRQRLATLSESKGLSATFEQQLFFTGGGIQRYSGTLDIRKPGLFRWQYLKPYKQLYLGDGSVIWHYEPDLAQAERLTMLDSVDPVVMKLLDGRIGADQVDLLEITGREGGVTGYRVKIAGGPELLLAFSGDGSLRWLESSDMLGNRNRMSLLSVKHKVPDRQLFRFKPPEGVEVVDLTGGK